MPTNQIVQDVSNSQSGLPARFSADAGRGLEGRVDPRGSAFAFHCQRMPRYPELGAGSDEPDAGPAEQHGCEG